MMVAIAILAFGAGPAPLPAQDFDPRLTETLYSAEDAADFLSRPWKFNLHRESLTRPPVWRLLQISDASPAPVQNRVW